MTSPADSPTRRRSVWFWLAIALLSIVLLLIAAGGWLLASDSGWRQAARWANDFTGGMVRIDAPSGRFSDAFGFERLEVRTDTLHLVVDDVRLDWSPAALTRAHLQIDSLDVGEVRFATAPSTEESAPPSLPASLALPITVSAPHIAVGKVIQESFPFEADSPAATPLIETLLARFEADGNTHQLVVETLKSPWAEGSAEVRIGARAPYQTQADVKVAAEFDAHQAVAGIALRGPLEALEGAIVARSEGARVDVSTQLTPFAASPLSRLVIKGEGIDPARWQDGAPAADLSLDATFDVPAADAFTLTGPVQIRNASPGSYDAGRVPVNAILAQLNLVGERIKLDDLRIELPGEGRIAGTIDAAGATDVTANLALQKINAQQLDGRAPPTALSGDIALRGDAGGQHLTGEVNDSIAVLSAVLDVRHADQVLSIEQFKLIAGKGQAAIKGQLALAGTQAFSADIKLDALDPSKLLPDAPSGRISGSVNAEGQLADLQARGRYKLADSRLMDRPLAGEGSFDWQGKRLAQLDALLVVGDNRLKANGAWGRPDDRLTAKVSAPRLDQIAPQLGGAAQLDAQISGGAKTPAGKINGRLTALRLPGDLRIASLNIDASLAGGLDGPFTIDLTGGEVSSGPKPPPLVKRFALDARGTLAQHTLALDVQAPTDAVKAKLQGGLAEAKRWDGQIEQLKVTGRLPLTLRKPTGLSLAADRVRLSPGAFTAATDGELVFGETIWQPGSLTTTGRMSGLRVGLETRPDQGPKGGKGDLQLGGEWDLNLAKRATGTVRVFREAGDLVLVGDAVIRFGLSRFEALVTVNEDKVAMRIEGEGTQLGKLAASATAGLRRVDGVLQADMNAPLLGSASLDVPSIAWLGPVASPTLRAGGALKAEFSLSGTPAKPIGAGQVNGEDLSIEIAEEGLRLSGGTLSARFDADRLVIKELSFVSPSEVAPRDKRVPYKALTRTPGTLKASGEMRLSDGAGGITFEADRLPVFQRVDRWLAISGKGRVQTLFAAPEIEAQMRADAGYLGFAKTPPPSLSSDVVIIRPEEEEEEAEAKAKEGSKLSARIGIDLGKKLYLAALGLETRLAGKLTLVARAGAPLRATGSLQTVGGTFEGYGQDLSIERGVVNFQGPLDNPGLDVVALRKGLEVEAGVSVSGTVRRPRIRLVSNPDVPDPQKLSWIVLGRAPDEDGGADMALLLPAAQALLGGPGGGMTDQLAAGLGIDEFSIGQGELNSASRTATSSIVGSGSEANEATVGGQVLSVGKRLSAKTTVKFEQSLSGVEQLVKITHQLSRRLSIIGRTGTDNSVDLRWSISFR